MPVALAVDWNAARLHLITCQGNYEATAKAFGVSQEALRQRACRGDWLKTVRETQKIKKETLSRSVTKTAETLASMSEDFKFNTLKAAVKASKQFVLKPSKPRDWAEMKQVVDCAKVVGGFGAENGAVNFQLLFGGSNELRDVSPPETVEVESSQVVNDDWREVEV